MGTLQLLASCRILRYKQLKPSCWLLSLPRTPWRWKRALLERDALIADIACQYRTAALGTDEPMEAQIAWRVLDEIQTVGRELPGSGSWLLLMFDGVAPDFRSLPERVTGECQDLQAVLTKVRARTGILSLPDDIEWIVVETPAD
jgi:hypothetical protein